MIKYKRNPQDDKFREQKAMEYANKSARNYIERLNKYKITVHKLKDGRMIVNE